MLQQTQVERVILKYNEFIRRFSTFASLAKAHNKDVLRAWQGLGYNRRALYLKKTAEIVTTQYNGKLPPRTEKLTALPGVGKNTAGAILAYAFNIPVPFIETNIRRAYIHRFFSRKKKVSDKMILALVERTMDRKNPRRWYWALMDYGAALAKQIENPNRRSARYRKQSKFEGSDRQLRGRIIKVLLEKNTVNRKQLAILLEKPISRISRITSTLKKEGMVKDKGNGLLSL